MEELFKYIPGRERQKIAEDWYKYGADPGVCEDMAMDLYSVEEFRQNLAQADEERCELYWGLCKVTRDGVGDWSEDFGERSDFLQLMTDVHLSKALTDFGCQGRAPSTCHGRVFFSIFSSNYWCGTIDSTLLKTLRIGLRLLKIYKRFRYMQVRCRCRRTCIQLIVLYYLWKP